ncbi:MAG: hypothetical protein ACFFC7_25470 [Candidatus Hermodarchaeota archaeon]
MSNPEIILLLTKVDSIAEDIKQEKKNNEIQFFESELKIKPSFQVLSIKLRLREEELDDYQTLKELLFRGLRTALKNQNIEYLYFGGQPILEAIKDPDEIDIFAEALINSDCAILVCATTVGTVPPETLQKDLRNIIRGLIPQAHFLFVPEVLSITQQEELTLELEYNKQELFGSSFPQVLGWMMDWIREEFDKGSQLVEKYSSFGNILFEIVLDILSKSIQEDSPLFTLDTDESIYFLWNIDFFYQILENITRILQEGLKELKLEGNIEKQMLVHLGVQALGQAGESLFGNSFEELIEYLQKFLEKERAIRVGNALSQTISTRIMMVLEEFSCILPCEKSQRYFMLPKAFLEDWTKELKKECPISENAFWQYVQKISKEHHRTAISKPTSDRRLVSHKSIVIPSDLPTNNIDSFTDALVNVFPMILELFKEKIKEEDLIEFTKALQGFAPYEEIARFKPELKFADWLAAQKNSSQAAILEELFIIMEDMLEQIKEKYSIEGSTYYELPLDVLLLLSFRKYQAIFPQVKNPNFNQYKLKALFQLFRAIQNLEK